MKTILIKISNALVKVEKLLIYILLPLMCIIILANTFARYTGLFTDYLTWAEELARYIMIYMAFIGAALVMQNDEHYKMTAVVDALPARSGKAVRLVSFVITVLFAIYLAKVGFECCNKILLMGQKTPILKIPMTIPYAAIPIGMTLGSVQSIIAAIIKLMDAKDKEAGESK